MFAGNWFENWQKSTGSKSRTRTLKKGVRRKEQERARGLRMETLEDRRMLATFVVNNLGDLDAGGNVVTGSLRQAVQLANANEDFDTIVFADYLFTDPATRQTTSRVIQLDGRANGRQLTITQPVEILGPSARTLTIQGGGNFRIFETNIGSEEELFSVTIGGMTISGGSLTGTANGDQNRGGAIFNRENLTVIETSFIGNSASWGGGAIYSARGNVTVRRSYFNNNSSGGGGGAILIGDGGDELRPSLFVSNSTFAFNNTSSQMDRPGYGGAIFNFSGDVEIANSTIADNSASAGGGGIASYGVGDIEGEVMPIVTQLTQSIVWYNGGGDIHAVRNDTEGAPLAPTFLLDVDGNNGANFIGSIFGAVWADPDEDGRGNFYQVVSTGMEGEDNEGISWTMANAFTNFGQGNYGASAHLATIDSAEENEFVAELASDPAYWTQFQPEEIMPEDGEAMTPPLEFIGPWLGGRQPAPSEEDEPAMGWEWVDGAEFDYTNWFDMPTDPNLTPVQPNNGVRPGDDENAEPNPENFLSFFGEDVSDTWGDLPDEPEGEGETPIAYVIEFDEGSNFFNIDPGLGFPGFYGGPTPVYYPPAGSPVIDQGFGSYDDYDQRGIHFTRFANGGSNDIGSVEVQNGQFQVDYLLDESDGQYVQVSASYSVAGDFSLREALLFSEENPEVDTITFSNALLNQEDPTSSPAPTILAKLRDANSSAFVISDPVTILGPTGFELEIDAAGLDPTPTINNSDGTRVFTIDDGSTSTISVSISGLTLIGGDVVGNGGAILNQENLVLENLRVRDNYASTSGGGISTRGGAFSLTSSALFNNFAGFQGGGLFVDQAASGITQATVSNSTISGNNAARGAGITNNDGQLLIEYSTITNNTAPIAAGIANLNQPNTFTQLHSTIVAANNGADLRVLQSAIPNVQSLGFNLVGNTNVNNVFIQPGDQVGVTNPMLGPLVYEGGFTPVHPLLAGSPAIDAGDSAAVAGSGSVPTYDQRGFPFTRVYDGLQDTKDRLDIGAYELQGTVFIVDSTGSADNGDYSAGDLTLREAISLSNSNPLRDTIMFDIGLQGSSIFHGGEPMQITDSVNIVGLGQTLLTIDGAGGARVFTIDDEDVENELEVVISDLTFTNSMDVADDGGVIKSHEKLTISNATFTNNSTFGAGNNGGAIYQRYGSINLDNVTISGNTTDGVDADGGGIYVRDADLTITNSVITGNSTAQTQGSGGGIYIRDGVLNMDYTTVASNLAPGAEADGGALFGLNSVLNITNSYITGNSMTGSNSEGAGIHARFSDLTLTSSYVALNSTTGSQSEGAGIYLRGGTALIEGSTISQNTTTGHTATGGGIALVDGELVVRASSVSNNSTSGLNASGGGIHNLGGQVTIVDSTISGNSVSGTGARGGGLFTNTTLGTSDKTSFINSTVSGNSALNVGGGIYNAGGLLEISHSTITENSVPLNGNGGGVASLAVSLTTLTRVYSSIISGNFTSQDPGQPYSDVDSIAGNAQNTIQSLGFNLIGRGLPLALNAFIQPGDQTGVTDPRLSNLVFTSDAVSVHELLEDSPAVNAGDPSAVPGVGGVPEYDQRGVGFPRSLGGRMDIGATESPFVQGIGPDFDDDGDVDGADFLAWQRGLNKVAATKSDGDANIDGQVNSIDLGLWQEAYGTEVSGSSASSFASSSLLFVASEPLVATVVYETSPANESSLSGFVAGLSLQADDEQLATEPEESNFSGTEESRYGVQDQAFGTWAATQQSRFDEELTSPGETSSESEIELSLTDEVFELLGS